MVTRFDERARKVLPYDSRPRAKWGSSAMSASQPGIRACLVGQLGASPSSGRGGGGTESRLISPGDSNDLHIVAALPFFSPTLEKRLAIS